MTCLSPDCRRCVRDWDVECDDDAPEDRREPTLLERVENAFAPLTLATVRCLVALGRYDGVEYDAPEFRGEPIPDEAESWAEVSPYATREAGE